MEISVAQPNRFKKIFEVLKELYGDLEIIFNEQGFGFHLVDRSKTAFASLDVKNSQANFPTYRCPNELKICLSMEPFSKAMHPLNNEHQLILKVDDDQADCPTKMTMEFKDSAGERRTIGVKLSSSSEDEHQLNDYLLDRTVQIESQKLRNFCADVQWVSENITITLKQSEIELYASGDHGDYRITVPCVEVKQDPKLLGDAANALPAPEMDSDITTTATQTKGDVRGTYPLRYLRNFLKAQDLAPIVKLALSSNGPMMVRFEIPGPDGSEAGYGVLQFFLAPINTEDTNYTANSNDQNMMDLI